jgi:hypothetical protein
MVQKAVSQDVDQADEFLPEKKGITSKFVESQRSVLFRIPCDFRGPEENPALAGLLAIMSNCTLPGVGGVCYFFEAFGSSPRRALRMTNREFRERGYPADACGAICLSFRALTRLS